LGKRWKALLLALVPGLGHLYVGRHWRGLLTFALFALAVNGVYAAWVMDELFVGDLCRGAAAAAWCYSVAHIAYLSRQLRRKPVKERKDYHFKRGLTHYLAGAFGLAKAEFLTVLKLDPMDVDARFHLGMTFKALGDRRKAAKAFKRCLADDIDAKWKWEIDTEMDRLKSTS